MDRLPAGRQFTLLQANDTVSGSVGVNPNHQAEIVETSRDYRGDDSIRQVDLQEDDHHIDHAAHDRWHDMTAG